MNLLLLKLLTLKNQILLSAVFTKQHSMDVGDFNNNFINNLIDNVSKEQKSVLPIGDFNINLLNYNYHRPTKELLDSLASNSFLP